MLTIDARAHILPREWQDTASKNGNPRFALWLVGLPAHQFGGLSSHLF